MGSEANSERAAQWDDCILEVFENGLSPREACQKLGLPVGSWHAEATKRKMWTPKPRGFRDKSRETMKKAKGTPTRQRIPEEVWGKIFDEVDKGALIEPTCRKYGVSRSSFAIHRRKGGAAGTKKKATRKRPSLADVAPRGCEIELESLKARFERLSALNMQLMGENKAYKAMLRAPTRRRSR